ncbi:dihydrofolate reductase family protein [Zoogloea sp.]|jgi:dihydrofolate reductase|uniref:dihydrofolate reductase family protein n=1 Tax=Zoogloea sp. TaxID=49181 RepID=UPI0035AE5B25|nr:dihydrofolate reductase family protein [Rhodocyclales bacterium]
MKPRISVFVATSLDGYIARPDGGVEWLDVPPPSPTEDYGFQGFFETVDTLVMGRHTFEKVLSFDPWPYARKPVIVLSRRVVEIPAHLQHCVTASSENPAELASRLWVEGRRHLYVDGGITIQGFLAAGLVDELTITRIPILLGGGVPLFGALLQDVPLTLQFSRSFANGLVQTRYRVSLR